MVNFTDHPPHRPDPGKANDMETDSEPVSQELNTQEFEFGIQHGAFPEHTDYIKVTRSRTSHFVRFPVTFFGEKSTNLSYMADWVKAVLTEVVAIKPGSFKTATLLRPTADANPKLIPVVYLLFQVYSDDDVDVACKLGGKQANEVIYFEPHSANAQAAENEREIQITSLAWNTTNSALKTAAKKYGEVQSITTTFNSKMTMKEALVIFASAESVTKLKDECATCLVVQDDVGTITRLGTQSIAFDPSLTLKLCNLPHGTTPADLKNVFDTNIKTPNAIRSYHTITMPLGLKTKRRSPEAYVKFSDHDQQQLAAKSKIILDGRMTMWLDVNVRTCFHCGMPGHFQRDCEGFQKMLDRKAIYRANAAIIRGTTPPSRSLNRSPLTQVPAPTPTQSTPIKQSTPKRPINLPTQGRSYAAMASSSQNNKGNVASNPISVPSTSSGSQPAGIPSTNRPQAASLVSSATTDWTTYFQAQLAKLDQKHKNDYATVRADMFQMNQKLDLVLAALQQPSSIRVSQQQQGPAFADGDEDIVLTEPSDPTNIVPDSLPSTPQPLPPTFNQQQEYAVAEAHPLPESTHAGKGSYSRTTLRTHAGGGSALAKKDPNTVEQHDEDARVRKNAGTQQTMKDKNLKGKRMTQQTQQTQQTLAQMVATLMAENERMRGEMATLQMMMTERETAYTALRHQLEQQRAGNGNNNNEEQQYASMNALNPDEYRGVDEYGSMGSTNYRNNDDNDNSSAQPSDNEQ
ncbi:hypothetical protein BGX24_004033 [Mortierella sp. AD032]|nr:hypothetical protein BGX24_004033 [Mortierella sp. AD032]